jgi:hypothetical protein
MIFGLLEKMSFSGPDPLIGVRDGDKILTKVETMRKMARESRQLSYSSSRGKKGDISGGQHG